MRKKSRQRKTTPRSRARDDDRLMNLGFSGGKACGGFPSCLLTGAGREPGQECEASAHRRLALDAVSVLCYPSPGRWKKRSTRTRSQLQNGAVYGGLGAAPSTSNLGSSRQRKSQVWPRWVPRGIACRFLVPRIYALSGFISSNEKRGRLHILLLIIRIFQFDGSVNDTFHDGQILLRAKL